MLCRRTKKEGGGLRSLRRDYILKSGESIEGG